MRRVVALLAILVATAAHGDDRPLRGWSFSVENPLPSNPHRRAISVRGRSVPGRPTPALVGDPLADGVTVTFFTESAAGSAIQAFLLPPGAYREPNGPGWTVYRSAKRPRVRYAYGDERGENGSITSFQLDVYAGHRADLRVWASGRGNNPTITIVPPNPGSGGGITASIPGGDRYCVVFGGAAGGRPARPNDATRFKMRFARSAVCPPSP